MRVMFVYPNERLDTLIGVGIPLLSAHLKQAGHEVKLYDTTFFDTGKASGDGISTDWVRLLSLARWTSKRSGSDAMWFMISVCIT